MVVTSSKKTTYTMFTLKIFCDIMFYVTFSFSWRVNPIHYYLNMYLYLCKDLIFHLWPMRCDNLSIHICLIILLLFLLTIIFYSECIRIVFRYPIVFHFTWCSMILNLLLYGLYLVGLGLTPSTMMYKNHKFKTF